MKATARPEGLLRRRQIPEKTGVDPGWSCLLGSNPGQVCSDLGRVDVEQAAEWCIPGDEGGFATPTGVVRFLRR